jgi:hypothetical protein
MNRLWTDGRQIGQRAVTRTHIILFALLLACTGLAPAAMGQQTRTDSSANVDRRGDLVLEELRREGNTLAGRFTTPDGRPVAGVDVDAAGPEGRDHAKTDERGTFVIRITNPGLAMLTARHAGYGTFRMSLEDLFYFIPQVTTIRVHEDGTLRIITPVMADEEILRIIVRRVEAERLLETLQKLEVDGTYVEVRADDDARARDILRAMGAAMEAGVEDVRFVGLPHE